MDDKADPSSGWPVLEVQKITSPAAHDWYAKLFMYVHEVIERFLHRLQKIRIGFVLYNVDARELPQHLDHDKYARVEVCFSSQLVSDLQLSH
jgi:hypothetical protein